MYDTQDNDGSRINNTAFTQTELDALLRQDFSAFLNKAFLTVNPGRSFLEGWYLRTIAHQLQGVRRGGVPAASDQHPSAISQIVYLLGRIFGVLPGARSGDANQLHKLFPGPGEQVFARCQDHHGIGLVQTPFSFDADFAVA
jgi:hypothetical protein